MLHLPGRRDVREACVFSFLLLSAMLIVSRAAFASGPVVVVDPPAGDVVWKDAAEGAVPVLGDLPLTVEPGDPRIPYRDVRIVLPEGRRAAGVRIVVDGLEEGALEAAPAIAPAPRISSGEPVPWNRLDSAGERFPAMWGELLGTSVWHGVPVATVRIYPLRLVREPGTAGWISFERAASFRIEVDAEADDSRRARRRRAVPGEDAMVRDVLESGVVNPAAVASMPAPAIAAADEGDGFQPTSEPSLEGSLVDFVVVTNEALSAEFQRFADYKTARGLTTVVRSVEWIGRNYPSASDLPATIRDFLIDCYERWGTRFVLLGGDINVIPTRMIHSDFYPADTGSDLPVDLYYAGLDGNWNADGDDVLGEPYRNSVETGDDADLVSELYLGRAPVCTAAEAGVFVDKVIAYERDGVGDHYGNILFLSEVLFPSDYSAGDEISEDGAAFSEAIIDSALAGSHINPVRLYETSDLWPGSQPENYSSAMAAMQSGDYGIVNHIGHGFFYNMSVGATSLSLGDASALRNAPHYFLLYGMNCASAAFDYNSIQERFLLNPLGGAVFSIGSARASFPGTATQYQRSFYEVLMEQDAYLAGEVISRSRAPFDGATTSSTLERWTHLNYVVLGDPSLVIWTDVPLELDVAMPDSLPYGDQLVPLFVTSGGSPVPEAVVCLSKDGDDFARTMTNASGYAQLPFSVKSSGSVAVSIMGRNLQPRVLEVPIRQRTAPYLRMTETRILDDGTGGTIGNSDGLIDSGETVALYITCGNSGGTGIPAGGVGLSSVDPYVQILSGPSALPGIDAGSAVEIDEPFLIRISQDAPDRHVAELVAEFSDSFGDEFSEDFEVDILAPDIGVSILAWTDWQSGDGDGRLEPDEPIRVTFSLRNSGWGTADNLSAWIEPKVAGFIAHSGTGQWAAIPRLSETDQIDEFIITSDQVAGATLGTLHVVDAVGHSWSHNFDLDDPAQPEIVSLTAPEGGQALLQWGIPDPSGEVYGYHIFRTDNPYGVYERITGEPIRENTFFRDVDLDPMHKYYYRVAALDTSRILGPQSITASVSTAPSEAAGFPIGLSTETSSHMVIGDVDGNGILDAVLPADDIYIWDARGMELRDGDGDPETLGPFTGIEANWGIAGATLANLTNRPGMEIIASNRTTNEIWVFQGDGSVADGWPRKMSQWNWATPAAGDLDGDGDLEIVVTTVNGRTYAWHHDGTEVLDGDADPATDGVFHVRANEWYNYCSPLLLDVDHDGAQEVLTSTRFGTGDFIHALKADGTEAAGWPFAIPGYSLVLSSLSAADLDGDGHCEIVFTVEGDKLYVLEDDGTVLDPFPVGLVTNVSMSYAPGPACGFGDFDDDGILEIVAIEVVSALESHVHVIGLDGQDLPGWPLPVPGDSEGSPIVGDLNGDGRPDVVFGIGGGGDSVPNQLHVFDGGGWEMPGFPLELSGPLRPTPALADFDADGDIDIVYGGWDLAMHVWDLPAPYVAENVPWPMFCGNPLRTGVLEQEWVTAVGDPVPLVVGPELYPCVPNPFNPATRITFALPEGYGGMARLVVYDVRGRAVASLVEGRIGGGLHEVDWLGRDDRGRAVASGIYFYRLETDLGARSGKMTLVR